MKRISLIILVALLLSGCMPKDLPGEATKANNALRSEKITQAAEQDKPTATTNQIWWLRDGVGDKATKLNAMPSGSNIIIQVDNLVADDGGVWWLVQFGGYSGYINSRCCSE